MNYLAHLHLAHVTQTSLVGAVLGDFIKGQNHLALPPDLQLAVRLHRKVDAYTEDDSTIRQAKVFFDSGLRRFAGIALDVFWDHCLVRNFAIYTQEPLDDFVGRCYEALRQSDGGNSERYRRTTEAMMAYDWLTHYAEWDGVARALQGLSRRRPFLGPVADCVEVLEQHQGELQQLFATFYPELMGLSVAWCEKTRAPVSDSS